MGKATRYIIAALIVPLLGLAACGGGEEAGEAPEPAPSETFDCETAESSEEWEEHGCDEAVGDEGQAGGTPVPLGEPFEYEKVMSDDAPTSSWKVTLTEVECGLASIPEADMNPDYDGSDDIPEYVDAEPDEGNEFCILHWGWENVGKVPGQVDAPGDMMLGDEQHARSEEDQFDRSWTITETHLGIAYADDVNPGKATKSLDVYQVPAGAVMDAVWFPAESMMSGPYILVATK